MKNQKLLNTGFLSHYERQLWDLREFNLTTKHTKEIIQNEILAVFYTENSNGKPYLYLLIDGNWCVVMDYYRLKVINISKLTKEKAETYYGWIKKSVPERVLANLR